MSSERSLRYSWVRLMAHIPRRQRRLILPVLVCNLLVSLLEAVGVGVVLPLVAVLTTPSLLSRYPKVANWIPHDLLSDRAELALIATTAFGLLFVLKNIFIVFASWLQGKLISELQQGLSVQLFKRYLQQPYLFHVDNSTHVLINRMQQSVSMVVNNYFKPVLDMSIEIVTLTLIVGMVITLNPLQSLLGMSLIGLSAVFFHRVTKSRIAKLGKESQGIGADLLQSIQQPLSAIKDVRILAREGYFHDSYAAPAIRSAQLSQKMGVINMLPRLIIETATVLAVLIVIAVLAQEGSLETLAPSLALLAAAAFRLMPSINRITMSMSSFRFGSSALDVVLQDLDLPQSDWQVAPKLPFERSLVLRGVSFSYPTSARPVLNGVDLNIIKGESIGFIGKTGAGKSTLIDIILGLLTPGTGQLLVDGVPLAGKERSWQRNIGYVPQAIVLIDDTLRANIALGIPDDEIDEVALTRAVTAAQLDEVVAMLPDGLDTRIGERGIRLSGGQRQRVGIARALYPNPDVLVLDEATSALDNETEGDLMNVTNSLHGKKTLLIIAHRTSTLMGCDRIVLMKAGRIEAVDSPPAMAAAYPRLFHGLR